MCHMSCVMCQVSGFKWCMFFLFFDKVVELVDGGSVINEAYPVKFLFISHCFILQLLLLTTINKGHKFFN